MRRRVRTSTQHKYIAQPLSLGNMSLSPEEVPVLPSPSSNEEEPETANETASAQAEAPAADEAEESLMSMYDLFVHDFPDVHTGDERPAAADEEPAADLWDRAAAPEDEEPAAEDEEQPHAEDEEQPATEDGEQLATEDGEPPVAENDRPVAEMQAYTQNTEQVIARKVENPFIEDVRSPAIREEHRKAAEEEQQAAEQKIMKSWREIAIARERSTAPDYIFEAPLRDHVSTEESLPQWLHRKNPPIKHENAIFPEDDKPPTQNKGALAEGATEVGSTHMHDSLAGHISQRSEPDGDPLFRYGASFLNRSQARRSGAGTGRYSATSFGAMSGPGSPRRAGRVSSDPLGVRRSRTAPQVRSPGSRAAGRLSVQNFGSVELTADGRVACAVRGRPAAALDADGRMPASAIRPIGSQRQRWGAGASASRTSAGSRGSASGQSVDSCGQPRRRRSGGDADPSQQTADAKKQNRNGKKLPWDGSELSLQWPCPTPFKRVPRCCRPPTFTTLVRPASCCGYSDTALNNSLPDQLMQHLPCLLQLPSKRRQRRRRRQLTNQLATDLGCALLPYLYLQSVL